uniref:Uncharacterized protein n=1 Tax=Anguilla anguilla TaxID=7936 RepID=A0A0E9WAX5_ANGAN
MREKDGLPVSLESLATAQYIARKLDSFQSGELMVR